jgi:hypothetical protein
MKTGIRDRIFNIEGQEEFLKAALQIHHYQFNNNIVYNNFIINLGRPYKHLSTVQDIPFIPIEFFRNHKIITGNSPVETIFESSGTTGVSPGRHFVCDLKLYEESFFKAFRRFYGDPEEYFIAAMLPSYTERENSSLVYMADKLIKKSRHNASGFYKGNDEELLKMIDKAKSKNQKTLLLGVSFALLDFAENNSHDLSGVIIVETGGMKGRRKELTRFELHKIIKEKFNVQSVHSEYSMTELMSQAYSKGNGLYYCPPWMKVMIRDPQDPLTIYSEPGKTGGINIIDLANINSCSFIATGDLGRLHDDGGFEVLGRFDNSDIRGCNLLAE